MLEIPHFRQARFPVESGVKATPKTTTEPADALAVEQADSRLQAQLLSVASRAGKPVPEVWRLWRIYAAAAAMFGATPCIIEFTQWRKVVAKAAHQPESENPRKNSENTLEIHGNEK